MKLRLERAPSAHGATIGELYVDGVFECYTCEDEVREIEGQPVESWKVKGRTAIARGSYPVGITPSARFHRDLPILGRVKGFDGVRIHPGNTSEDTEGCILPGQTRTDRTVGQSKAAFSALFDKIRGAINAGDYVSIEIV